MEYTYVRKDRTGKVYLEGNYIRKDLTGKVTAKLPWRELRSAGELQKEVYRGSPMTYENPKDPDITELIYEILPIADGEQELDETKKRAESPLTSKTIAFKLRKEKGIEVQPRTVTKRIRELGRKVKGQKMGRYLGYSVDQQVAMAEMERSIEWLDEIEKRAERGEDALEVLGEQTSILKANQRQEDHVWF